MTTAETTHFRTCPLCEATCGLEIELRDGAITRIRGDRDDVFSRGFICPKGSTLKQLHADPDRLRTPLVKRNGVFEEATWDEAFATVAEGLGRVWAAGDRDAVAVYLGNPTAHSMAGALLNPVLLKALRTKNVCSASTVDQMPMHVASGLVFGGPDIIPVPDLDRTDHLLMLGANPHESNGSLCTAPDFPGRMEAIRARGGRIVTVDPRRTKTALASDEHLAIRPGSDALWLAAVITEVANAGLVDLGTVGEHVDGLDTVIATLAPFTAESVAAHTRIDAATTRRIAHEFARAERATVYTRIGAQTNTFGTLTVWLAYVLNTITGNLDRPGGAMFPLPASGARGNPAKPGGRGFVTGRWASRVSGHPEVRGEIPVAALAEEIETPGPGQVRALVTFGGNPVRSCPNSARLDAAFATLDFMVSVDIYVNETTRHADVILPSPSPLAKPHFDFGFYALSVRNVVNFSPPLHPATDPSEPGMDEHEIVARLALVALGQPDADPQQLLWSMVADRATRAGLDPDAACAERAHLSPIEARLDLMVQHGPYPGLSIDVLRANPHGIDLGPLTPRVPEVLKTPTGRIDLAPPAVVADVGRLVATLEQPPAEGLLLVGRRHLRSNNSWMHNLEVLVKGKPRCTVQVHPDDAAASGVADGTLAAISSAAGTVHAHVEVTDDVAQGTVSLPHGWGHDAPGARLAVAARTTGANSNALTDDVSIDPLSGNARLNAIPVTLQPVGA